MSATHRPDFLDRVYADARTASTPAAELAALKARGLIALLDGVVLSHYSTHLDIHDYDGSAIATVQRYCADRGLAVKEERSKGHRYYTVHLGAAQEVTVHDMQSAADKPEGVEGGWSPAQGGGL